MFGVSPEEIDKTASVKHEITNTFQKMSHVRKKYQEEEILNKYAYEAAENAFIKTARQMIINETTAADRTQSLATVHHFCKEAGLGETYKKPLAKLAYALTAEGMLEPSAGKKVVNFLMEKSADQKVPTELISPLLKARVVNGNHPLYIKLKTLKDCQQAYDLSKDRFQLVDDKLQILGQKVRAL